MRVAALYDIHGNLPALEAVLAEVAEEGFDRVVIGGDAFWGPWPAQTLARLRELGLKATFVLGNCDREVFAFDPADPYLVTNAWVAARLTPEDASFVASWPQTVSLVVDPLGELCFCHATPGSDTALITPLTPAPVLAAAVSATSASIVVCGHTHVQFELGAGERRIVNAGSVGFGYEGKPGAFWLELGQSIRHRRTVYDVEAAAAALSESGWPGPYGADDLLSPGTAEAAIRVFESRRMAGLPG